MRVGIGYDSHAFIPGDAITLGGIAIPFTKSVRAHSDGDVLLHALGDALLGAAALGDLGHFFPDHDPQYKNMPSSELLRRILKLLQTKQFQIINVDSTIITEAPKLSSYIPKMREKIAAILEVESSQISIKAKTNEKMGWIGRAEGLAAQAVVLLANT